MNTKKATQLVNIRVSEITLCKKNAVPGASILVMKSDIKKNKDDSTWSRDVVFKAFDQEKQIAYGYALVPDVVDSQDEIVTEAEVEKTAHGFLEILAKNQQDGLGVGHEHKVLPEDCYPVESVIDRGGAVAKSMGVAEEDIRPGGWWIGVKMSDEYWEMAKSGDIKGFSIGGISQRIPPVEKTSESSVIGSVIEFLVKKVSSNSKWKQPTKLEKAMSYDEVKKAMSYDDIVTIQAITEALFDKTWSLMDSFYSIMDDDEVTDKVSKVEESVSQYLADIKNLDKVEKSIINKSDEGDSVMDKEQYDGLVGTLEGLKKSVEEMSTKFTEAVPKKEEASETEAEEAKKAEEVKKAEEEAKKAEDKTPIEDDRYTALEKTVKELTEKLETVSKTPDLRNGDDGKVDTDPKKDTIKSIEEGGLVGTALSFRQ
jgi:hypothetical protein